MRNSVDTPVIPIEEIEAALQAICASRVFKRAVRSRRLLRYLVANRQLADKLTEYAIGLAVFERKPAGYAPRIDPIVRVQMGRLRRKLSAYYSTGGLDTELEISLPPGAYRPVIRRLPTDCHRPAWLVSPIKRLPLAEPCPEAVEAFDRLLHKRLQQTLSATVKLVFSARSSAPVSHRLEGSIRLDADSIKASLRLIEASRGRLVWSEQFQPTAGGEKLWEELATIICSALLPIAQACQTRPNN